MTQENTAFPPLRMPGATLTTRVKVFDAVGPDGQCGGTPHFHFLCTEMYFVLTGSGAVEMIDQNGFDRVELQRYSALIFSPGTIHRLINPNGDLELLVIMQNSGLPDRGDSVVSFSPERFADEHRFQEAMRVANMEEALRRRDRGVEGFLRLKAVFAKDAAEGRRTLHELFSLAAERVTPRLSEWKDVLLNGAVAEAERSVGQLDDLAEGQVEHLLQAQHHLIHADEYNQLGSCGHLHRYLNPAALTPEGVVTR